MNKDGYNDIIVGAPYTNSGEGAIFVYLGSKDGIRSTYSQVWFHEFYLEVLIFQTYTFEDLINKFYRK